jgi:hypothetical protein
MKASVTLSAHATPLAATGTYALAVGPAPRPAAGIVRTAASSGS